MCGSTAAMLARFIGCYGQNVGSYATLGSVIVASAIDESPSLLSSGTMFFDSYFPLFTMVEGLSRILLSISDAAVSYFQHERDSFERPNTDSDLVKSFFDFLKGVTHTLFSFLKLYPGYRCAIYVMTNAFDFLTDFVSVLKGCPDKIGMSERKIDPGQLMMKALEVAGWLLLSIFINNPAGYLGYAAIGCVGHTLLTFVILNKIYVNDTLQTMREDFRRLIEGRPEQSCLKDLVQEAGRSEQREVKGFKQLRGSRVPDEKAQDNHRYRRRPL